MKKILACVGFIAALILFGIVGNMDYEDALLEEKRYCENVAEGVWPDYKGIFEAVCKPTN
ncbi:hypothetical protein FtMidnight_44 [Enterobacteria phage FtMidnight]